MPMMIDLGKELLRINPKDPKKLEFSSNGGRMWMNRFSGVSYVGEFKDLVDAGKELLATTSQGLFFSTNGGRMWMRRNR